MGIPQFGLVAEQVEKVNPDLVARDEQGKPYTVRYEAVNAMLLNEFLKEHRKVEQGRQHRGTEGQRRAAVEVQRCWSRRRPSARSAYRWLPTRQLRIVSTTNKAVRRQRKVS